MDQKQCLAVLADSGEYSITELCQKFDISRATGQSIANEVRQAAEVASKARAGYERTVEMASYMHSLATEGGDAIMAEAEKSVSHHKS